MDKITPRLPRGCTGGESIYTLARHHWPPSGHNTPLVVGASGEIDTEPLLSARFVIALQSTYSDEFYTNTDTNNNYNVHERNENSSSKRIHLLFWSVQWDRVHGLKVIVADIFMQWLIQFYTLMMMRQNCSPLKFLAVSLIKKINVIILLLMYKSTETCLLNLNLILPHSTS